MNTVLTTTLEIAYEEHGPGDGPAVILMHGFPDDVHAYDGVAPPLAASRWRVIVPYLRGYGPTRFRDPAIPRSGQQAALGHDLLSLLDGLAYPPIVGLSVVNCGSCGRRITVSMTPNTREPPNPSTTPILSRSRSIPTATAIGRRGAIQPLNRSKSNLPDSR